MSRCPEARPPPAEISLPYKNVCHGGYFVGYTDSPSGAAGRQATVTARQTATTERRQADGRQEKSDCGMSSLHGWLRRIGLDRYAETFAAGDIDVDLLPQLTRARPNKRRV